MKFKSLYIMIALVFSVGLVSASWTSDLNDGLIAYYTLNETSGKNVYNSHNGSLSGYLLTDYDATWKPGIIGNGILGGGNSNTGFETSSNDFNFDNNYTLSLWIFSNYSDTTYFRRIIAKKNYTSETGYVLLKGKNNNLLWGVNESLFTLSIPFNNNSWNHVAIVYNGTHLTFWLNGTIANYTSYTAPPNPNNLNLTIGNDNSFAGPNNVFHGLIDEIGIWGEGLNSSQINNLFNGGNGLTYSGKIIFDYNTYDLNVYETQRRTLQTNITFDKNIYQSISAILTYNGTNYTGTSTEIDDNSISFSKSLDIPLIFTGDQNNISFFWNIIAYNGTGSNSKASDVYNQTINRIRIEQCNATWPVVSLNITAYEEQNQTRINPLDQWDGQFDYWLGGGTVKRNGSFSNSSGNETRLCISPNETFTTDGFMEYEHSGYPRKDYYLNNYSLTNTKQDLELYLLANSEATTFIVLVQNINQQALSDHYVYVQRYYPGTDTYETVQIVKTDENGKSVAFYKTEEVYYRHIITDENGTVLLTTNKQKVFIEDTPATLIFTIGSGVDTPWQDLEKSEDLVSSLTYNNNTKIVSFVYEDPDSGFNSARLYVEQLNSSGRNAMICNVTSSLSIATIPCDLSTYTNSQFVASGFITRDGTEKVEDIINFEIQDKTNTFGFEGLFLGWLIIVTAAFGFLYNPVAGIWVVNFAVVFVNLMGFVYFSPVFIFSMISLSIIITVAIK